MKKVFVLIGMVALICILMSACRIVDDVSNPSSVVPEQSGDNNSLVGRWEYVSGVFIHYFANDGDIEFFAYGRVIEYAYGEPGRYTIIGDGRMSVEGEQTGTHEFTYSISGDMLTITDHDGDRGTWRRAGTVNNNVVVEDSSLIGRWEYVSGRYIYYFTNDGDIEFFADGRVIEYAFNESGRYTVFENNRMSVDGEQSGTYEFSYLIEGDMITITDQDGDSGTWRRR
ncbi:MAG: hypothetical protein FWE27_06140 [Defluviitaleaceae bacterium]|nr:hypothetical protein [Defluviitaleaceae bacterium]